MLQYHSSMPTECAFKPKRCKHPSRYAFVTVSPVLLDTANSCLESFQDTNANVNAFHTTTRSVVMPCKGLCTAPGCKRCYHICPKRRLTMNPSMKQRHSLRRVMRSTSQYYDLLESPVTPQRHVAHTNTMRPPLERVLGTVTQEHLACMCSYPCSAQCLDISHVCVTAYQVVLCQACLCYSHRKYRSVC